MREFKISERIGYIIADNIFNDETDYHEIERDIDIKPVQQRLHCDTHVINIVDKATLYGTDTDCHEG